MRTWWHLSSPCWAVSPPADSAYSNRDINEQYPLALHRQKGSFPYAQRRRDSTYYSNFSELKLEDDSGLPHPAGGFGGMFPRRSAEAGQEDCNRYFQPWVKGPGRKR